MKVEQIYTGCLAQGAYYIVSENEAVIIDPLRETKPYLERLKQDGVTLKYILETHFHADFVSGHLDLSRETGAPIVYGPTANPEFEAYIAKDEEVLQLGKAQIKVLHTPGHTLESTTYLLIDPEGQPHAIFSGDTLFLGDVGRPDLAQKDANLTQQELAGMLYDSLEAKILPLPDDLLVYPAHGAGSACGKNMQKETVDTLGNQKKSNYALNQPNRESFIEAVLDGLSAPPKYFGMNVEMNKKGYQSFDKVLDQSLRELSPAEFQEIAENSGALILDTRNAADFHKAFIPNSINIGLKGDFAPWVGSMIVEVKQPLLLVTDQGTEEEAITRLSRVGFDNVLGYLKGGMNQWIEEGKEIDEINRIPASELKTQINPNTFILDVRKESEFEKGHLEGAVNLPLSEISQWTTKIKDQDNIVLHCQGGYRSMIAGSILNSRGIRNFKEVEGGFNAIKKDSSLPLNEGGDFCSNN